ncbi:MAG TPA: UDP-2,3-diacylglucosamine diphosphatase [Crocinitomix sp.]|nr:UDP-2,3-diacylglucosamine diphosphatase [Crocinitomix sp.]
MTTNKKIYFASDFHLGVPSYEKSLEREKKIIAWLEQIEKDAEEIFLLGDVFDFWFEYKRAIPKGFVRLQGKIANLTDKGIKVHWFLGNHDMWIFDYIPKELGVELHQSEIERKFNNQLFFIGHGDGLGPGDKGYKFIKKIFRSKISQWFFARLHPNFGVGIANFWSHKSRKHTADNDAKFYGEDKEMLIQYCKQKVKEKPYHFFVFGHRHYPIDFKINESSRYINTGDWISYFTYAVFDGENMELKTFKG